jgi:hypothetical protein
VKSVHSVAETARRGGRAFDGSPCASYAGYTFSSNLPPR